MRELCCCLLLAVTIASTSGCRGKSPQSPVARHSTPAASTKAPAEVAEPPPEPVALHRPAVESLPAVKAVPKKKFGDALRQAHQALDAGRIDERNLSGDETSPESDETSSPATSASGRTDALALYRGVLATDPKNAAAGQGIDAIVAALHARSQAALAHGDIVDAQRDGDRIALLRADDVGLQSLHAALDKGWHVAGLIERGQRLESA
ncbi:MAG TPA: hypothetical protein VK753_12680, partial [Xanthomonadaceae bacterium]|nr:hypothetical protein [Xanthomonadaceae bacterium]